MTDSKKKLNDSLDYYSILNVDNKCSKKDIDTAYRSLAMIWHPDKYKGDRMLADKKFREISEAYHVLSNDDTRKNYDLHGVSVKTDNLIDPYDIFKNIFDTEENSIPDVIIKINCTMDQLYKGFTESVNFKRFSECSNCESTGTHNKEDGSCIICRGRGICMETVKGGKMGYMINEKKCDICDGSGINPDIKKCKMCNGDKYIKEDIECDVDVPAGAYDNYYIKLENEGNFVPKNERKTGAERTDVVIVIKEIIKENNNIVRGMFIKEIGRVNRSDLLLTHTIKFEESICGIKVEIDFLANEKIGIEINNVILNGDIHVIENMGMPLVPEEYEKNNKKARGDLFIVFKIERPVITRKQQNRLWQVITNTSYPIYKDINNIYDTIEFNEYINDQKSNINN